MCACARAERACVCACELGVECVNVCIVVFASVYSLVLFRPEIAEKSSFSKNQKVKKEMKRRGGKQEDKNFAEGIEG